MKLCIAYYQLTAVSSTTVQFCLNCLSLTLLLASNWLIDTATQVCVVLTQSLEDLSNVITGMHLNPPNFPLVIDTCPALFKASCQVKPYCNNYIDLLVFLTANKLVENAIYANIIDCIE